MEQRRDAIRTITKFLRLSMYPNLPFIVEIVISARNVTGEREATILDITSGSGSAAKTGDTSPIMFYSILMMAALLIIIEELIRRRRRAAGDQNR